MNDFPKDGFADWDDAANVSKYIALRQPARLKNLLKDAKDWVDQEAELGRNRTEALDFILAAISEVCRFT